MSVRRGQALSAVAVVAGLAAVYGVGALSHPATLGSGVPAGRPSRVMVSSATRACAAPGSVGPTAASVATTAVPNTTRTASISTGASAAAARSAGPSSVVISRLSAAGSTASGAVLQTLTKPDVLNWSAIATAPQSPVATLHARTPSTNTPSTNTPSTNTPSTNTQSPSTQSTRAHDAKTQGTTAQGAQQQGTQQQGTQTQGANGAASSAAGGSGSAMDAAAQAATKPGRGGVVVQATGAMAQGLAVEQSGPDGLISGQCPAPGTDFWFVGPGVSSASQIDLYLMNTDSEPADVQVNALTDSGPPLGSSDSGIVVPPHGIVVQQVSQLLKGSRVVALHVSASGGRIAASVRESTSAASNGVWLPAAQAPARDLVIPGLPGSSGPRQLYIAVPGTGNAQIKVTAVTARGSYQPTGGSGIDLAGDSAVSVGLPSLSGVAGAIKVSSSVPVTAAILVPGGATGAPGAMSATTAPITQQGIVAASPAGPSGSADLVISAPGQAATVSVAAATAKIPVTGQTAQVVHIPRGHSVVWHVRPPHGGKTDDCSIVVTPQAGSGPVYVGRVISSRGVVRTILPVMSALTWIALPSTQDSLGVVGSGN